MMIWFDVCLCVYIYHCRPMGGRRYTYLYRDMPDEEMCVVLDICGCVHVRTYAWVGRDV